jgi:hypothetical protein
MLRKKCNVSIKIISFLLAVLFMLYAVPSIVYAEAIEGIESLSAESSGAEESTAAGNNTAQLPVYEVEELRQESSKTFRLSDGSFTAVYYADAVHRKDGQGVWQDIDNRLTLSGGEYTTADTRVKFAKKINGNGEIFTLHEGNTKITLYAIEAVKKTQGTTYEVNGDREDDTELGKLSNLEKLSSRIVYEGALPGADLEYIVTSNNIKENIIVKEGQDSYIYSFTLKLNNLTALLCADGSVSLYDGGGAVKYKIPAPVIYDAAGVYAEAGIGSYTLLDNGNGSYTLTVTADSSWMNSAERAFPVVIDPTINGISSSSVTETYISKASPDASWNGFQTYIDGSASGETIYYWKLNDLSSIPDGAFIVSAKFDNMCNYDGFSSGKIGIYMVETPWDETLTYNGMKNNDLGEITEDPFSYINLLRGTTESLYLYAIDVTRAFLAWKKGGHENYGIAFKMLENSAAYLPLYASQLSINYRVLNGIEDYYTYFSHGVGTKGAGNLAET